MFHIILIAIFLCNSALSVSSIEYKNIISENHSIHILKIEPNQYQFKLVRALDSGLGRESVVSMGNRLGAIAGINGGFFVIGGTFDGRPAGACKIDKEWFSFPTKNRGVICWDANTILFDHLQIKAYIQFKNETLQIDGVNVPAQNNCSIVYYPSFNRTTLTNKDYVDILIDKNGVINQINHLGNSILPTDGKIISIPKGKFQKIKTKLRLNTRVNLIIQPILMSGCNINNWNKYKYILSGAPLLIAHGEKIIDFSKEMVRDSFLYNPHARTALGITKDGQWIFVVVDHDYSANIETLSLKDLLIQLKKKGYSDKELKNCKLKEIQEMFSNKGSNITGLTIPELTDFMDTLGCIWALNLDGGGSSTLYYQGKVLNHPMGDEDEEYGEYKVRRVSDAIMVLPKQ